MKSFIKPILVLSIFALLCTATYAGGLRTWRSRQAAMDSMMYPWHGQYYSLSWGMPVALVVPPTAENQTKWGWGVGNTRVVSIDHQFSRNYPGPGHYQRSAFRPTPAWPSNTDQFGVYYVRGPWR